MALAIGTNVGFVSSQPTTDPAGADTTSDGSSFVVKDTSPSGLNRVKEVGWYKGSGSNSSNTQMGLYAADGATVPGEAGTRLNVTADQASGTSAAWIRFTVNWLLSASTAYWIGMQQDAHSSSSTIDSATSGGAGIDSRSSQTALTDPYGGGALADADGMYAMYALYEAIANADTLTDNFDNNSLDTAKWETYATGTGGAGTVQEISQHILMTPSSSVAGAEVGLISLGYVAKYNLTSSYYLIDLSQVLTANANTSTRFYAIKDDNNLFRIMIAGSPQTVTCLSVAGGTPTEVYSGSYNATTMRWLRIREASGKIYFDYSSDGSSWSSFGNITNPFAITMTYPKVTCIADNVASPGAVIFDSFNTAPSTTTSTTSSSSTSTTSTSSSTSTTSTSSSLSTTSSSSSTSYTTSSTSSSSSTSSTSSSSSISTTSSSSSTSLTTTSSSSSTSTTSTSSSTSTTSSSLSTTSSSSSISTTSSSSSTSLTTSSTSSSTSQSTTSSSSSTSITTTSSSSSTSTTSTSSSTSTTSTSSSLSTTSTSSSTSTTSTSSSLSTTSSSSSTSLTTTSSSSSTSTTSTSSSLSTTSSSSSTSLTTTSSSSSTSTTSTSSSTSTTSTSTSVTGTTTSTTSTSSSSSTSTTSTSISTSTTSTSSSLSTTSSSTSTSLTTTSSSSSTSQSTTSSSSSTSLTTTTVPSGYMASLVDNFNDNSINTGIWNNWGGGQVAETNQELEITTTTSAGYYGIDTLGSYELTGSSVYIRVKNAGNQSLTSYETWILVLVKDGDNNVCWAIIGGNLIAYKKVATTRTALKSVAYNSAVHGALRIREAEGVVYWDYAASTTDTWVNFTSETVANLFAITDLMVEFVAGTYGDEASTTVLKLDNLNTTEGDTTTTSTTSSSTSSTSTTSTSISTSTTSSSSSSSTSLTTTSSSTSLTTTSSSQTVTTSSSSSSSLTTTSTTSSSTSTTTTVAPWSGMAMDIFSTQDNIDFADTDPDVFAAQLDAIIAAGINTIRIDVEPYFYEASVQTFIKNAVTVAVGKGMNVVWGMCGEAITAANWSDQSTAIQAAATWAQANGVYEFIIGNEEEYKVDGTTITVAQLITNLKTLATTVQGIFTRGRVVYCTSLDFVINWQNAGIGDIDALGWNIYAEGNDERVAWQEGVDATIQIFGADHTFISEFGPSWVSLADYSANETTQATKVQEMIAYFKGVGIQRAHYFTFYDDQRSLGPAGFGAQETDLTYRELWDKITGSGSIAAYTVNKISTLTDNFNDSSIDTSKWISEVAGSGTISEGTVVTITPAASTAGSRGVLTAYNTYDLTSSSCFVNITSACSGNVDCNFQLRLNSTNKIGFTKNGTTLYAFKLVADTWTAVAETTYNATTHAWLRIWESLGTTYWDYSSDGNTWTNWTSAANPIKVNLLVPQLSAIELASVATPGTFVFDNFNIASAPTTTSTTSSSTSTTSTSTSTTRTTTTSSSSSTSTVTHSTSSSSSSSTSLTTTSSSTSHTTSSSSSTSRTTSSSSSISTTSTSSSTSHTTSSTSSSSSSSSSISISTTSSSSSISTSSTSSSTSSTSTSSTSSTSSSSVTIMYKPSIDILIDYQRFNTQREQMGFRVRNEDKHFEIKEDY